MSTNEDSLINKENPNGTDGTGAGVCGTGFQKIQSMCLLMIPRVLTTTGKISKMDEGAGVCVESGGHFNVVIGKEIARDE